MNTESSLFFEVVFLLIPGGLQDAIPGILELTNFRLVFEPNDSSLKVIIRVLADSWMKF